MLLAHGAAPCCRLCDIARETGNLTPVDTPWLSDANYVAFVSIGALVPGWSLIAPRRHVLNMADDYKNSAFWDFAGQAAALLERQYGPCVVFEHGSQAADSATSCGTSHAHLHMVPLTFALTDKARDFSPSHIWEPTRASEISNKVQGKEYLFVSDRSSGNQTEGYLSILQAGQSQYFRRVIANELGRADEYDYKLHPQREIAEHCAVELAELAKIALARAA